MNSRQFIFVCIVAYCCLVVFVAPHVLSFGSHPFFFAAALGVVALVQPRILPAGIYAPSPLQILKGSAFWTALAAIYTAVVVVAVSWHLFVFRLEFFDDVSFPLLFLLILGPAIGPMVVNLWLTYQLLGERENWNDV